MIKINKSTGQKGVNIIVLLHFRPVYDYPLERVLSQNFSYTVNVFHNEPLTLDFLHATRNKTHTYKTSIVPNDPADFGRNSYQSSTLNSIFESLKHSSIDILKIESLPDHAHSHEVLYFMVKDHLLKKVRQLHLALYVGKSGGRNTPSRGIIDQERKPGQWFKSDLLS